MGNIIPNQPKIDNNNDQPNIDNTNNDDDDFVILKLNDHCLLKIFEYLGCEDTVSLGKTSDRLKKLAHSRYKKFTFEFHSNMLRNDESLNSTLLDISEHMESWSLTIKHAECGKKILKKVGKHCHNLKTLKVVPNKFIGLTDLDALICKEAVDCFSCVETLIFDSCTVSGGAKFFSCFRKLKYLSFSLSYISSTDVKMIFENNPDLESFYCYGGNNLFGGYDGFSEFNLCKFGPKFDKLCLSAEARLDMNSLLRLATTNLTKLKLSIFARDFDNFLIELAKNNRLKELEMNLVELGRNTFNILSTFTNLKLLVFIPFNMGNLRFPLDSTLVWPPNLKDLQLKLHIRIDGFVSIIKQLEQLENLVLAGCKVPSRVEKNFYNIDKMSRVILRTRKSTQKLNIVLPDCKNYIVDSDGMRISEGTKPDVRIHFPTDY